MSGHNLGGGRPYLHAPKNRDDDWLRPSERLMLGSEAPNVFSLTATPHSFSPHGGSPQLGDEYSLYRSRSASVSSSSSANSTGTVCESEVSSSQVQNEREIVPFGHGIKPGRRRKTSAPLHFSASESVTAPPGEATYEQTTGQKRPQSAQSKSVDWKSADAGWRNKPEETQDTGSSAPDTAESRRLPAETEDDSMSLVSTVSGSGIDFFRKFVQRRKSTSCKDCEDQFRREVLIDRLVSDSQNKVGLIDRKSCASTSASQYCSENDSRSASEMSDLSDRMTTSSFNHSGIVSSLGTQRDIEGRAKMCASRCKNHQLTDFQEDAQSRSSGLSRQSSMSSSISGSGLLFLRNYLKKKKPKGRTSSAKQDPKDISAFNIVPVPFPPPSDFYGPAFLNDGGQSDDMSDSSSERRLSVCSTVADLLNEDFDCDDSELKNLDWEEWDEPLPDDISYDDLVSVISESFYSDDLDMGDLCELDWEGRKTVVANDRQVLTPDEAGGREKDETTGESTQSTSEDAYAETASQESCNETGVTEVRNDNSRSRFGSFKSSTFMQDLEAELELPPMTPVSDEKEEAVRAISRTISKYIRTGSNSSYGTDPGRSSVSQMSTTEQQGRYSRKSNVGDEVGESGSASRLSVYSPALSDCLPELAPTEPVSPAPYRRPLSQLLQYDCPQASGSPQFTISPSPDVYRSDESTPFYSAQGTPSTVRSLHNTRPPSQSSQLHMFTRPSSYIENRESSEPQEPRLRGASLNPGANRDSLLADNYPNIPPSPGAMRSSRPYLRHSSSNSTDSGCPLFEDKVASLSPTPSPHSTIETLSSNRNKLASFWERSIGTGTSTTEVPLAWLSNKDGGRSASCFQPFGSENSLSVVKNDRLSHFLDLTKRAAAEKNPRSRLERRHRASTGSDCSDLLDRENPLSPLQPRRRESFTEYFV